MGPGGADQGGSSAGGNAAAGGDDAAAGGNGGAPPTFPPACTGTTPVAGAECTIEDVTCDAPTTMTLCGQLRFRCCDGRWRQKEACDGAASAPNQASCDTL